MNRWEVKSVAKDEDLYTEHAKNVYRYLFSLSGEADTAEELTQETFYRALKSLDSYRGEASPQVWLCAIAKRLWRKCAHRSASSTRPRRSSDFCADTGRGSLSPHFWRQL